MFPAIFILCSYVCSQKHAAACNHLMFILCLQQRTRCCLRPCYAWNSTSSPRRSHSLRSSQTNDHLSCIFFPNNLCNKTETQFHGSLWKPYKLSIRLPSDFGCHYAATICISLLIHAQVVAAMIERYREPNPQVGAILITKAPGNYQLILHYIFYLACRPLALRFPALDSRLSRFFVARGFDY